MEVLFINFSMKKSKIKGLMPPFGCSLSVWRMHVLLWSAWVKILSQTLSCCDSWHVACINVIKPTYFNH